MLPLYLLTAAKTKPILIELKNGETLNGDLVNCDSWMNLTLKNVIQSSANGEDFLKIPEIYIRGNHIKYLRLPDEIMDHAKEQTILNNEQRNRNQKRRNNYNNSNYNNSNNNYNNNNNNNNNNGNNNRRGFNQRGGYNKNRGGYNNNNNNNNNSNNHHHSHSQDQVSA